MKIKDKLDTYLDEALIDKSDNDVQNALQILKKYFPQVAYSKYSGFTGLSEYDALVSITTRHNKFLLGTAGTNLAYARYKEFAAKFAKTSKIFEELKKKVPNLVAL